MPSTPSDDGLVEPDRLNHEALDDYRIPRSAGKKELSVEARREIFRKHYRPSAAGQRTGRQRRLVVAGGVLLLGIGVAVAFALSLRSQKDSVDYAIGLCQLEVMTTANEQDQAVAFDADPSIERDADDIVTEVAGDATAESGSTTGAVQYTCQMSLTDEEYVVDSLQLVATTA